MCGIISSRMPWQLGGHIFSSCRRSRFASAFEVRKFNRAEVSARGRRETKQGCGRLRWRAWPIATPTAWGRLGIFLSTPGVVASLTAAGTLQVQPGPEMQCHACQTGLVQIEHRIGYLGAPSARSDPSSAIGAFQTSSPSNRSYDSEIPTNATPPASLCAWKYLYIGQDAGWS